MLAVTAIAKEKLNEALQQKTTETEMIFRIVLSPSQARRVQISLDREREGDQVVKSEEGAKLLLVAPDVASALEGLVLDYKETPLGRGFTLSKLSLST